MSHGAVRAGALRNRVRFEKINDSGARDAHGQRSTYETVCTLWAKVVPSRGNEAEVAMRAQGREPVTLEVHKTADSEQITPSMRMVWINRGAAVYEITSVRDDGAYGRKLIIEAVRATGEVAE